MQFLPEWLVHESSGPTDSKGSQPHLLLSVVACKPASAVMMGAQEYRAYFAIRHGLTTFVVCGAQDALVLF